MYLSEICGRHHGRSQDSFGYDVSTAEGLRINTSWVWGRRGGGGTPRKIFVRPPKCTYAIFLFSSGALRQEKLELSAQVKKLHAAVDHLQGSLNQVYEEVTL